MTYLSSCQLHTTGVSESNPAMTGCAELSAARSSSVTSSAASALLRANLRRWGCRRQRHAVSLSAVSTQEGPQVPAGRRMTAAPTHLISPSNSSGPLSAPGARRSVFCWTTAGLGTAGATGDRAFLFGGSLACRLARVGGACCAGRLACCTGGGAAGTCCFRPLL